MPVAFNSRGIAGTSAADGSVTLTAPARRNVSTSFGSVTNTRQLPVDSPHDPTSVIDVPDDDFEDQNCDGIDGTVEEGVFVAEDGSAANPGTREFPLDSINDGIDLALSSGLRYVYLSAGNCRHDLIKGHHHRSPQSPGEQLDQKRSGGQLPGYRHSQRDQLIGERRHPIHGRFRAQSAILPGDHKGATSAAHSSPSM